MRPGQFLRRVVGAILLLVGFGALVALLWDTADWTAPRGRHSAWVGGRASLIRGFVAGTCISGGLAVLGRAIRRGKEKDMGSRPQE
jgi:hypothetical protein